MSWYRGPENITIYDTVLDHFLNSPTGDTGRYMHRIGVEILEGARRLVGRRSGRLLASLYLQHDRRGQYQYVQVGSNLSYAYVHHEGERPHLITPHRGRMLRFNSGGRMVFARVVHHPGARGRKYLTIPLRRAVRR